MTSYGMALKMFGMVVMSTRNTLALTVRMDTPQTMKLESDSDW